VRIDQWVPALHRGDAIGDSARHLRDVFRSWGHTADVFALDVDADLAEDGRPFHEFQPGASDDLVILHYALPSPMSTALPELRCRRMLIHHSVTPPEFFGGWDEELARICALGRDELPALAPHVELALGDSEHNRRELEAAGFRRTGVLPIYLDFARYREPPSRVLGRVLGDGRTNLLFVGRVAPNKRHEDLIRLAAYWKKFISPDLRLLLVGKLPKRRHYFDALQALMYEEGFTPAEVLFTGHVDHRDLLACYAESHVFVSMSEHEGFGVPLVEAMLMGVPVLAHRAAAVPDTLGEAGVQFGEKRVDEVAEMAHLLATDQGLRSAVLAGQRRRLQAFAPAAVEGTLKAYVDSL
jgi:glycosyltransferase involved in cell wall biosynthesis